MWQQPALAFDSACLPRAGNDYPNVIDGAFPATIKEGQGAFRRQNALADRVGNASSNTTSHHEHKAAQW